MNNALHVQFGCGACAPPSWINFDASWRLAFERLPIAGWLPKYQRLFPRNVHYGNIVRGLPVGAETCIGLYCSHVLEHLTRDDTRKALRNCQKYLRPGGVFRIVVPDLEMAMHFYKSSEDDEAALRFLNFVGVSPESDAKSFFKRLITKSDHRWMWDFKSLSRELLEAGFTSIRRCQYGDAADSKFLEVEDAHRFENALALECTRL